MAQFKLGDFSTHVAPRLGRPQTVTTPEIIDQIHKLVLEDRRISASDTHCPFWSNCAITCQCSGEMSLFGTQRWRLEVTITVYPREEERGDMDWMMYQWRHGLDDVSVATWTG